MRGRAGLATLLLALACRMPEPEPLPRILGASPEGEGVSTGVAPEIRFSAPVDPDGLIDGRLLVLATSEVLRDAITAVESDAGAADLPGAVPVDASAEDGGARVVLRTRAPLRAYSGYALVLSSRLRAADGRPVLDPEGRHRTFVASFGTGAPEGPPPAAVITEVLSDADTPEAGGEYVEIVNVGATALDLGGFRLAKRTTSGTWSSCAVAAPPGSVVPPGGLALLAGGAYDGRYALPAEVPVMSCGATALLGGIANDRAPELLLSDPGGNVLATFGSKGAPVCARAAELTSVDAGDEAGNIVCTEGTPGVLP
jgi:hypothetical protein